MYRVELPMLGFRAVWQNAARTLASHRIAPEHVEWVRGGGASLFAASPMPAEIGPHKVTAPSHFIQLAQSVICNSDPEAPALAYQALCRHQENRAALSNPADPLTQRLERLTKAIRRDIHKMHAFVRFREIEGGNTRRRFGAWFEPDHLILEPATPFFAKRFADMDWMISTPQGVAHFEDARLSFHPAAGRPDLPDDASEALWKTYFANIFNPARVKISAMKSEMPVKYWKNLPETRAIPEMLAAAEARVQKMRDALPSEPSRRAHKILERQSKLSNPKE